MQNLEYLEHEIASAERLRSPLRGFIPDWRVELPVMCGTRVTLRELRIGDASSMLPLLISHEVSRFMHMPPTSVDAFERFVAQQHEQRRAGTGACFAVT